jgi:muramidase (phage lysozyme)
MPSQRIIDAARNANVRAFLRMLRHGETMQGDDAYRWLFGSTSGSPKFFDSFKDHPRVRTYEKYDGQFIKNGKIDYTTAAGAYQIVESTWDPVAKKQGLEDFTPVSQDMAAIALIDGRGALDDVIAGRFEAAVTKCRREWASLPGAGYGQPEVKMAAAKAVYEQWGGKYDATQLEGVPPPPNPFVQEKKVAPFILAALPSLIGAVPELVKIFGSDDPSKIRNQKAVETVVGIAKDAIGAKNEQELVEAISDPVAASRVKEAVMDNWYELSEVGGGIKEAREYGLKIQGDRSAAHNPQVWFTVLLLFFPAALAVDMFWAHPTAYDGNLRTQIVTAFLLILTVICGFWYGSSRGSAKKDEELSKK